MHSLKASLFAYFVCYDIAISKWFLFDFCILSCTQYFVIRMLDHNSDHKLCNVINIWRERTLIHTSESNTRKYAQLDLEFLMCNNEKQLRRDKTVLTIFLNKLPSASFTYLSSCSKQKAVTFAVTILRIFNWIFMWS